MAGMDHGDLDLLFPEVPHGQGQDAQHPTGPLKPFGCGQFIVHKIDERGMKRVVTHHSDPVVGPSDFVRKHGDILGIEGLVGVGNSFSR